MWNIACKKRSRSGLTRREILKYGFYGGLAAGLPGSLWIPGCGKERQNKKPNIVMIVMDTVRRDHLSCYGYHRDTTPTLKKLLAESRKYETAYSVSSWTSPAHASLFTGLYPVAHKSTQENWSLDENSTTLAEVLTSVGYDTIGIVENAILAKTHHFDQGFLKYYETWKMRPPRGLEHENMAFLLFNWHLRKMDEQKPYFCFINLLQAHNPYNTSRQFKNTFVSDPSITINGHDRKNYYLGIRKYSDAEIRHLKELYDAEILYVDYLIRKFIGKLRSKGQWDETVFIVTSDHGENIGDHDHVDHVFSLYQSTIRIPLIIHYPPLFTPGSRDTDIAQLTDIFPTLMNILGITEGNSQGIDLLKPEARKNRTAFCEYYRPLQAMRVYGKEKDNKKLQQYNRRLRSVVHNNMKLIWGSNGIHELYNLASDPGEEKNIIDSPDHSVTRRKLNSLLEMLKNKYDLGRQKQSSMSEELDKKTIEALKSLGYIQ